ncbi:MAG TPA: uracil-DNA glycosylase [Candidatus Pullichristensenella excrementigallinarum]|uniref:Type-4 uracil-DNA glycosylase n=1 Tax=Candidatus Pullichristensenella excrementigallinarum TaxID=2840907 RepID=A0A9D1IC42_9FIRM|nr:uracil-DNA glycosylase [Candidatus Pullichristensenella excrementigallinarum]
MPGHDAEGCLVRINWAEFYREIRECERCALYRGRLNVVPGEGNPRARLMLIGEGPGQQEDRMGRPFVGPSGELLTKMLHAIGLERSEVYICNIVKCRPPKNRNPEPEEAQACLPFLRMQVALVRPKIIVLLGKVACRWTLGEEISITRGHGVWHERKGVWFLPTFHPSALLRDPAKKADAWEDFQKLREKMRELEGEP